MVKVTLVYDDERTFVHDTNIFMDNKIVFKRENMTISFEKEGSYFENQKGASDRISGAQVRSLRKKLGGQGIGMSRKWFGYYFGKTEQTIYRWEEGLTQVPEHDSEVMLSILKSIELKPEIVHEAEEFMRARNRLGVIQTLLAPSMGIDSPKQNLLKQHAEVQSPIMVQPKIVKEPDEYDLKIKRIHNLIGKYCCHKKSCNGIIGEKCKCEWTHTKEHIQNHECDSSYLMRQLSHFGRHLAECPGYDARGFDGSIWKDEGYEGECNCGWSEIVPELPDETEVQVFL